MIVATSFFFVVMLCVKKLGAEGIPSIELIFFRNAFTLCIILLSFAFFPIKKKKSGRFFILILRGIFGNIGLFTGFYNLTTMPLNNALLFLKLTTLFVVIFSYIFLREKISLRGIFAIFLSFLGVYFLLDVQVSTKHMFTGLITPLGAALAYTAIRSLKDCYDSRIVVLSFVLFGTFSPLIFMFISEFYHNSFLDFIFAQYVSPQGNQWLYLIIIGICSTFAQILVTKSYFYGKAGLVSSLSYLGVIYALIFDFFFFNHQFSLKEVLSGFLIFVGAFLIIFAKKEKNLDKDSRSKK